MDGLVVAEVKRKECAPLMKVSKDKMTSRRQHPQNSETQHALIQKEVLEDMLRKGILPPDVATNEGSTPIGKQQAGTDVTPRREHSWETRGPTIRQNRTADIERAREKLLRFQHSRRTKPEVDL